MSRKPPRTRPPRGLSRVRRRWYSCNMTSTAIKPQTLADRGTDIDFDTRLALASAGIKATLDHKHADALSEAHAEAEAAIKQAGSPILVAPARFQPNDVLARAREIIETRGWAQGAIQRRDGAVCAVGAIRIAVYGSSCGSWEDNNEEVDATHELLDRIAATTGQDMNVPTWNDSRTTKDEVISLLY